MTPSQTDTLLGAVGSLREDMGRRFEDVKCDLQEVKGQLTLVDSRVSKIEVAEAIAAALVVAAKKVVDEKDRDLGMHTLTYRWRVTIAIAAVGASLAGIGQVMSAIHLFGMGQ
jgi:hypothetical protein